MKKLMIAAAAVAMIGMEAQAAKAQVYDVKAIVKSTYADKGDLRADLNPFLPFGKTGLVYRRIGTTGYTGAIWGCDCDAIAGRTEMEEMPIFDDQGIQIGTYQHWEGSALWRDSDGQCVWVGPTTNEQKSAKGIWSFINAIEGWGDYCEGVWEIEPQGFLCKEDGTGINTDEVKKGYILGAGFGTLANTWERSNTNGTDVCAESYVQQMSGYFAGELVAPIYLNAGKKDNCIYCIGKVTPASCKVTEVWDFCYCVPFMNAEKTAAFGEWSIQFNQGHATTLENYEDALDCLAFPKSVKEAVYLKRGDEKSLEKLALLQAQINRAQN